MSIILLTNFNSSSNFQSIDQSSLSNITSPNKETIDKSQEVAKKRFRDSPSSETKSIKKACRRLFDNCNESQESLDKAEVVDSDDEIILQATDFNFLTDLVPEEWFKCVKKSKGKWYFKVPKEIQKLSHLIYVFYNRETDKYQIGKTGGSFGTRIQQHLNKAINLKSVQSQKKAMKHEQFLEDLNQHPEDFEVGILYQLKENENLNELETQSIEYKREVWSLYNQRAGGGGGLVQAEEKNLGVIHAIHPDSKYTPEKRRPIGENDEGKIRPIYSPNFKEELKNLYENAVPGQSFIYSFKDMHTNKRYIGATADIFKRLLEHCWEAEYHHPNNEKYNPERRLTKIHQALAKNPKNFTYGILTVKDLKNIPEEERHDYILFEMSRQVETFVIKELDSIKKGFNMNKGGGGPVADPAKSQLKKNL